MHINAYSFGHITVDNKEYDEDLIIFPDKIKAHWRRQDGHVLRMHDLLEVFDYQPDMLIVGTGASGQMRIDPAVEDNLHNDHIKCVAAATGVAVKLFNEQTEKGTKAVGAFHLTS
jgi:hypothetical protein